jgi:hypothetical protein
VIPLSPKIVSYCLLKCFYEQQHFWQQQLRHQWHFFTKFDIIFYYPKIKMRLEGQFDAVS